MSVAETSLTLGPAAPAALGPWALGPGPWPLVVYYYIITPLFYILLYIIIATRIYNFGEFLRKFREFVNTKKNRGEIPYKMAVLARP